MYALRRKRIPLLSMGGGFVAAWHAGQLSQPSLTGDGRLADIIQNKHHGQFGSTSGADASDPLGLSLYEGKPYAYQPGISGNYCSVPTSVGFGGAVELELILEWAPDDITAIGDAWSQYNSGAARRVFTISWGTSVSKRPTVFLSQTGAGTSAAVCSADWPYANGVRAALKVTWRSSDGRFQFFTATDFDHIARTATWVQLGTNQSAHTGSVLFANTTDPVIVGGKVDQATNIAGKFFYASVATTIGGVPQIAIDLTAPGLVNELRTSFSTRIGTGTSATGTMNRAATGRKLSYVDRPLYLLGTDDYFEVPHHADLDVGVGDPFTVAIAGRFYGTPGTSTGLIHKAASFSAAGWSLRFGAASDPTLRLHDGTNQTNTVAPSPTAGVPFVLVARRAFGPSVIGGFTNGVVGTTQADNATASLANANVLQIGRSPGNGFLDFEFFGAGICKRASFTDAHVRELNRIFLGVPI